MHYEELIHCLQYYGKDPSRLIFEDELTGINNRRFLLNYFEFKVDWSALESCPVSLLMMDLDHFKQINDTYGHEAGDEVLVFLADLLKEVAEDRGLPIRYAGDEFMILLPEDGKTMALETGVRLLQRIRNQPFRLSDGETVIPITLSIGVASAPDDAQTHKKLLQQADTALYQTKQAGRDGLSDAGNLKLQDVFGKAALNQLKSADIAGRGPQLKQVTEAFKQFSQSQSQFVIVTGGSGIGKSTFLDSIQRHLAKSDIAVVKVTGVRLESFRPYYLINKILVAMLNLLPDKGMKLFESLQPDEFSYLTRHLLPLSKADRLQAETDESAFRKAMFDTLVDLLPKCLDSHPLIVLVDDFHYVDEATLILFRALMHRQDIPLFICGTASDTLSLNAEDEEVPLERFFVDHHEELGIHKIGLTPLTGTDIAAHLEEIFPHVQIPQDFAESLADSTLGNPLFLGEVLRDLMMRQKITLVGQQWVIQSLKEGDLPTSLEDIINHKLADLDPESRQLLAQAAIMGEDISLSLLAGSSEQVETKVLAFVDQATELGLIRSEFRTDDETIQFLSRRVLDIAYGRIQEDRKQVLHERMGQYQEGLYEQGLLPSASRLAYHYKRSANQEKARTYEQLQATQNTMIFNAQEAASYADPDPGEATPDVPLDPESVPLVRDVIRNLPTAVRSIKYYPPENKVVRSAFVQLAKMINQVLEKNTHLSFVQEDETLYVNGQPIDLDDYGAPLQELVLLLRHAGLRGLAFLRSLEEPQLRTLLEAIAHTKLETIDPHFWERFSSEIGLTHIDLKQIRYTEKTSGESSSEIPPPNPKLQRDDFPLIRTIVRSLLGAARNIKLYPINSKATSKSIHQLEEALHSLLSRRQVLTLAQTDDALLVNGDRIATSEFRTVTNGFLKLLNTMQISSLTFLQAVSLQELQTFISALDKIDAGEMVSGAWQRFAQEQGLAGILFDAFQYEIGVAATLKQTGTSSDGQDLLTHQESTEGEETDDAAFASDLENLPERINDLILDSRANEIKPIIQWLFEHYPDRDPEIRTTILKTCKDTLASVPAGHQQGIAKLMVAPLFQAIRIEHNPQLFSGISMMLYTMALGLLWISEYLLASTILANLSRFHQQLENAGDPRAQSLFNVLTRNLDRAMQNLLVEELRSGDPGQQQNVAQLLRSLGLVSVPPLVDLIKQDNDLRARQLAASILAEFGPNAAKVLKQELVLGTSSESRVRIMEVIDTVTQELKTELAQILTEKDRRVRQAAFGLAGRLSNTETMSLFLGLANHQETELATDAITCLGKLKVAGIATALVPILKSAKEPARVRACCRALGQIGDPVSTDALSQILAAKKFLFFRKWESELRVATALALEQIGHPQAVNALAPFANDRDLQVQKIARNAIETFS
jgi:diguanylate cyclase (GGDEF)-like protein